MSIVDKFKGLFVEQVSEEDDDVTTENTTSSNSPLQSTPKIAPVAHKNVVQLNNSANVKVVIVEPNKFDDAQKIVDCLREDQPVIINFEKTDGEVVKRITDFISGTVYAIDGSIQSVGSDILLCAPQGIDISANGLSGVSKKPVLSGAKEFSPWKEK